MPWLHPVRTHLGPLFNEGARQLWLVLEARGWSQTRLIRELDNASQVPGWLYGDHKPGRLSAKKMRDRLGIEMPLWDEPSADPDFKPPAARQASTTGTCAPGVQQGCGAAQVEAVA